MTELELQHLRREKWRLEGDPIRTLDDAREFIESVGLCLMYPVKPMPLLPTFVGAVMGTDQKLPTEKNALVHPQANHAEEFRARLAGNRSIFEAHLFGATLLLAPEVFPYFYALASDRKPKESIRSRTRGKASPLSEHLFRKLEEAGPLTRAELQERLGGALSESGIDRALEELWSALKITPVDHDFAGGGKWDVYYRWAPEAINEGVRTSDAEALSALISKYLDCVVAATQEEAELVLSPIASRARVGEVVRALLAARQFTYTPSETRTLITVARSNPQGGSALGAAPKIVRARIPESRRRNG